MAAREVSPLTEADAPRPGPAAQRAAAFRLRVVSALILAPAVMVITLIGAWPFAALVALAGLIMVYEWSRVIDGQGLTRESLLHALVVLVVAALAYQAYFGLAVLATGFGTLAAMGLAKGRHHAAFWPLLGTPYVALPVIALIFLRGEGEAGLRHMVWLLAVVWATDTAAFAMGRALGGPKLAPMISPNKTWSGLLGGVGAAGLVGAVAAGLAASQQLIAWMVLSAVLGAFSQVGDLAESLLKRRFGLKDTGTLIPGHGGMLDRLDGLLFAAPLAALWLILWGEGAMP